MSARVEESAIWMGRDTGYYKISIGRYGALKDVAGGTGGG
jgi:hypothetical protein